MFLRSHPGTDSFTIIWMGYRQNVYNIPILWHCLLRLSPTFNQTFYSSHLHLGCGSSEYRFSETLSFKKERKKELVDTN
jgi:hypothetical protein